MYDFIFKIVLLGDSSVGKTNIVSRFVQNQFSQDTKSTIAVEFSNKVVLVDNGTREVTAQIWDTSGQERYRSIASSYYRGALGCLACYDITNRHSFDHVQSWVTELRQYADEDCLIMVVGNKTDLDGMREISRKQGLHFARKSGYAFIETSAKEGTGVKTAFERLVEEIYKVQIKKQSLVDDTSGITLSTGGRNSEKFNTLSLDRMKESGHHLPIDNKCCSIGG
jgi:Ras-related protein Rab-11A